MIDPYGHLNQYRKWTDVGNEKHAKVNWFYVLAKYTHKFKNLNAIYMSFKNYERLQHKFYKRCAGYIHWKPQNIAGGS